MSTNATPEVTTDQLLADLKTVMTDAEALLRATSAQTGEKIQEVRARAEESLRQAKSRTRPTNTYAGIRGNRSASPQASACWSGCCWRAVKASNP